MRAISLVVLTGVLGTAACFGSEDRSPGSSAVSAQPRSVLEMERRQGDASTHTPLQADRRQHDFARIPINGGNVETSFQVSNDGSTPVRLVAVFTSCGCTSAVLEFSDGSKAGPFGMPGHGLPTEIDRRLSPGENVRVRVVFDPASHGPEGLGKVTRAVNLHTEDGGWVELLISAEVVRA